MNWKRHNCPRLDIWFDCWALRFEPSIRWQENSDEKDIPVKVSAAPASPGLNTPCEEHKKTKNRCLDINRNKINSDEDKLCCLEGLAFKVISTNHRGK